LYLVKLHVTTIRRGPELGGFVLGEAARERPMLKFLDAELV
jgi:hypothetical protein